MESVETLVNSDEVVPIREALRTLFAYFVLFTEILKANCASTLEGIVEFCDYISHRCVHVVEHSLIVFVLDSICLQLFRPKFNN